MSQEDAGYKLFIGGLGRDTTRDSLRSYFEEYGSIDDAVVMVDPNTQTSRGFGFVTFSEESAYNNALMEETHTIDNKTVEVKKAVPKSHMGAPSGDSHGVARVKKIFLGGLPQDAKGEDIIPAIEACSGEGTVEKVEIMTEKDTLKPRGFGFVHLKDPHNPDEESAYDVVDRLISKHKHIKILEREVEIKPAKSRDEMRNEGTSSRGRGSGGPSSRQSGYPPSNYGGFGYGRGDMPSMYGGSRGMGAGYYGGGGGYDAASYYSQPRRSDYPMGNPYSMYDRSGGAGYGYDSSGGFDYSKYYSMMSSYANSSSGYGPTRGYGEYKDRSGGDRGDSRSFHPYSRR